MAQHVLSLEAPDTLNCCQLRIVDTSIYNQDMGVKCPILEITPPGFNNSIEFGEDEVAPGFMLNITACSLGLQIDECGTTFADLSDGIWILKWSVSPNDKVFVEYNHLRITAALKLVENVYCDLDMGACEPDAKLSKDLNEIREIRSYLHAAKAKVEICHEPRKGMELYKYALKRLSKFNCTSCQNY